MAQRKLAARLARTRKRRSKDIHRIVFVKDEQAKLKMRKETLKKSGRNI